MGVKFPEKRVEWPQITGMLEHSIGRDVALKKLGAVYNGKTTT